jgi:hypothetical protein
MSPISDHMIYLVTVAHPGGAYMPERDVADLDRKTTVQDIATGQFEDVLQVIECNPVEKICHDVTEDIMREAADSILAKNAYRDLNDWQRDFVDARAA